MRRTKLNIIFFLSVLFFVSNNSFSQKSEGWFDYNPYYKLQNNLGLFGEVGFRTPLKEDSRDLWILGLNVFYKHQNWLDFLGGLRNFNTYFKEGLTINELRSWAGVKIIFFGPRSIKITNYLRSEYRILYISGISTETSFRFRNQLGITIPITRKILIDNTLYGIFDIEIFANTQSGFIESIADQMRIRLGAGYRWTKLWRFELIYTAQKAGEGEFKVDDHIFRFQIKHYLNY
jgi:hypothetical protein